MTGKKSMDSNEKCVLWIQMKNVFYVFLETVNVLNIYDNLSPLVLQHKPTMLNMTGIEEIVKYQQELLNHQRNQKLIQKETIKLLNALNKNITFMSDRLDEFALRTNIKLEANICPTNTAQQIHPININTLQELNNVTNGAESFFNNYDSTFGNLITTSNQVPITATPVTNQTISLNDEIKEYYILSDCNLEPLQVTQAPMIQQTQLIQNGQLLHHQNNLQPQQLILIRQDNQQQSPNSGLISSKVNLNSTNSNNNNNNNNNKMSSLTNIKNNKSSPNKKRSIKLLDVIVFRVDI